MAEFMSLKDAVATHLSDGMMAAFEGFTHLMPYA
ncbi:MAG: CoA transferase subunit A, partial [Candidatus Puniceispirillaceae bacterium]